MESKVDNMAKKGWPGESLRHSNAKRLGKAGPVYHRGRGINFTSQMNLSDSKIVGSGSGDLNIISILTYPESDLLKSLKTRL